MSAPLTLAGRTCWFHLRCVCQGTAESNLSPRSTPVQISDAFSKGHKPIAHAHRGRCPARVGSFFIECVIFIVIVLLGRVCEFIATESTFVCPGFLSFLLVQRDYCAHDEGTDDVGSIQDGNQGLQSFTRANSATNLTSIREPVETKSNLSQPPFFSDCDLCTSFDTLTSHSVSGRSTPILISDAFFKGSCPHRSCPQSQMPSTCWVHLQ